MKLIDKVITFCDFCGNIRTKNPSEIRYNHVFCSKRCCWDFKKNKKLSPEHYKNLVATNTMFKKGNKTPCPFKKGHKINLGRKHSEETRLKMRGRKHSEETKRKISLNQLGRKHSEETKRKMSLNSARYFLGKKHSEETNLKIREARRNQIFPLKDSLPEKMIQTALSLEGIVFEKHKSIKLNNRYYQPDIFINPNICIYINGCYWHYCKKCFKNKEPNKTQLFNIIRDKRSMQNLNCNGYITIILWEHDIRDYKKSTFKAYNHINYIKQLTKNNTIKKQDILIYPQV